MSVDAPTSFDAAIAAARTRVEAAAAALAALPKDLKAELASAEWALERLELQADEERFHADPLNDAVIQSLRRADLETDREPSDLVHGVAEFVRLLGTYGYDIVRRPA